MSTIKANVLVTLDQTKSINVATLIDDANAVGGKAQSGQNNDITALLALNTAISTAQGGTGASTIVSARANLGVDGNVGYINGLNLVNLSPGVISMTVGAAYIPNLARVIEVNNPQITPQFTNLVAGTMYHAYVTYLGTLEIVTTPPTIYSGGPCYIKTGDNSRRYVGSLLAASASSFYNFLMNDNEMRYLQPAGTFPALSGGTSTTAVNVPCSTWVPTTGYLAKTMTSAATTDAYFGNPGLGVVSTTSNQLTYVSANMAFEVDLYLDSSQQFSYANKATGGNTIVRILGYKFKR